jgi:hypothetical protein
LLPVVGVYKMAGLLPLSGEDRVMFRVLAVFGLGASLFGAKIIRDASVKVYEKSMVHSHERALWLIIVKINTLLHLSKINGRVTASRFV